MPIQSSVTQQGQQALGGMGQAAQGMQKERMMDKQLLASRMEQIMEHGHERDILGRQHRYDAHRQEDAQQHSMDMMTEAEKNRREYHQLLRNESFDDLELRLTLQNKQNEIDTEKQMRLKLLEGPYFRMLADDQPQGGGGQGGGGQTTVPTTSDIQNSVISGIGPATFDAISQFG